MAQESLKEIDRSAKFFVAGHRGMAGSAICRELKRRGFRNLLLRPRSGLDLMNQAAVRDFFSQERPQYVILAAGTVGGIAANNAMQAKFLYENLMIEANVIHSAAETGVEKLLFLGSSCIYPKYAPQPIREDFLLTGSLEPTNLGYTLAKLAGVKMCEFYNRQQGRRFTSCLPTNLYGPEDNFHPEHSHVIAGLMRRMHQAKVEGRSEVRVWGTGAPFREVMHVDDMATACVTLFEKYEDPETINIGSDMEYTIAEIAQLVKDTVGFSGKLVFDPSRPDGTPRKRLDNSKLRSLGWEPKITLPEGLKATYAWALEYRALENPSERVFALD